jgi:hypothetical protein
MATIQKQIHNHMIELFENDDLEAVEEMYSFFKKIKKEFSIKTPTPWAMYYEEHESETSDKLGKRERAALLKPRFEEFIAGMTKEEQKEFKEGGKLKKKLVRTSFSAIGEKKEKVKKERVKKEKTEKTEKTEKKRGRKPKNEEVKEETKVGTLIDTTNDEFKTAETNGETETTEETEQVEETEIEAVEWEYHDKKYYYVEETGVVYDEDENEVGLRVMPEFENEYILVEKWEKDGKTHYLHYDDGAVYDSKTLKYIGHKTKTGTLRKRSGFNGLSK